MAKIEFTGFVNDWRKANPERGIEAQTHPNWGMKVAESHRKKDEAGEYVTAGYTYRTVKSAYGAQIDFSTFKKGDRVTVKGTELTETREGTDGKKYHDLVVKAESVEIAISKAAQPDEFVAPDTWAAVADEDAPF